MFIVYNMYNIYAYMLYARMLTHRHIYAHSHVAPCWRSVHFNAHILHSFNICRIEWGFFFFNSSIFTTVSSSTSSIFSHNIASIIAVIIISNQHIKLSFISLLSIFAIQTVCVCEFAICNLTADNNH